MSEQVFNVERKRLVDQVADQLMALIADGQLKPGDRLSSKLNENWFPEIKLVKIYLS